MQNADDKKTFGTTVKARRSRLGLSQEQVAERANLHRTYISDVERGARNLSLQSIVKLAAALETSVAALFPQPECPPVQSQAASQEAVDILLVEDNADDVALTLRAFKMARFTNRVQVITDGAEALDYVLGKGNYARRTSAQDPQLILLDLNLPKVSGLEVLRRLKANKRTRMIPVVILTGSRNSQDIAQSLRLGAETYLVKPVDFQRLSEATPQLNLNWSLLRPGKTVARKVRA